MSHLDVISTTFIRLAQSLAGCINVFTDYNQTWTITRIGPVYSRYEKDYVLTWQGAQQRNVLDARLDIVSDRLLLFFDIAPFFPFLTRSPSHFLPFFFNPHCANRATVSCVSPPMIILINLVPITVDARFIFLPYFALFRYTSVQ